MNAIQFFQWGGDYGDVEIAFQREALFNNFSNFNIERVSLLAENRDRTFSTTIPIGGAIRSAKNKYTWIIKRKQFFNVKKYTDLELRAIVLSGFFDDNGATRDEQDFASGVFLKKRNIFPFNRYHSSGQFGNIATFDIQSLNTLKIELIPYRYNLPTIQEAKTQLTKILFPIMLD